MIEEMSANELKVLLTNAPQNAVDIGDQAETFRSAVADLRKAGVSVLVGPKLVQSDGRVSQHVSFGQDQSAANARML